MDIYFINEKTSEEFQFPSLPQIDTIKFDGETLFCEYDLMQPGEVKNPRGNRLDVLSFEGTFFNAKMRGNPEYIKYDISPIECVKKLKKWREDGDVIKVLWTETFINDRFIISRFSPAPTSYEEFAYSIELVQAKDITIEIINDKKNIKTSSRNPISKQKEKIKAIARKNDNRFRIAKRITQVGANYNNIPRNFTPGELIKIPKLVNNLGINKEDIRSGVNKFRGWMKK